MKKFTLLAISFIFLFQQSQAQISKGTWMLSGSMGFLAGRYNIGGPTTIVRVTQLILDTRAGYFLANRVAAGLKPGFFYGKSSPGNMSNYSLNIGPFTRYYFLKPVNAFNLFTEGSYSFGHGSGGYNYRVISISGGPVVYFNSTVGLEFAMGYARTTRPGESGQNDEWRVQVGFQFHLTKKS
jgi:hypothetical protein